MGYCVWVDTNERNKVYHDEDCPLFNKDAYREAVINALLYNRWISYNAPMFISGRS